MKPKLKLSGRFFLLILATALVLSPLVFGAVNLESNPPLTPAYADGASTGALNQASPCQVSPRLGTVKSMSKCLSNEEAFIPRISKAKIFSPLEGRFKVVSLTRDFSPRKHIVLRI